MDIKDKKYNRDTKKNFINYLTKLSTNPENDTIPITPIITKNNSFIFILSSTFLITHLKPKKIKKIKIQKSNIFVMIIPINYSQINKVLTLVFFCVLVS